jgi:hypothetical protein
MPATYKVVLNGPGNGANANEVAGRLATLLKLPLERAAPLLSKPGIALKRGIDLQTAVRYQAALEQAGCECVLQPEAPAQDDLSFDVPSTGRAPIIASTAQGGTKVPTPTSEDADKAARPRRASKLTLIGGGFLALFFGMGLLGLVFNRAPSASGGGGLGIGLTPPQVIVEAPYDQVISVGECKAEAGSWQCLLTNRTTAPVSLYSLKSVSYDANGVKVREGPLAEKLDPQGTNWAFLGGVNDVAKIVIRHE